jgi:isoaspartyl peptidase/L-asparaginase-like protein (Ntn-hydrolase superfamily)
MEKTPHVLLVGEGARLFAVEQGFPLQNLSTAESVAIWEKRQSRASSGGASVPSDKKSPGHDTVAVLALDKSGSLGGVCTTSGLAYKLPGRVGDSPIIGAGLYVDNLAGAAGATGTGEEIIRAGGSLMVVEAMRAGRTPQQACEHAIRRVNQVAVRRGVHPAQVAFLALDPKGNVGAACTARSNFRYAVALGSKVELRTAPELEPEAK